jgi:hypothetical protein
VHVATIITGPLLASRQGRWRAVGTFFLHQLIAAGGVPAAAPWTLPLFAFLSRVFGRPLDADQLHWVITGTPYYPVQIALALLLGLGLGRMFRHRTMLWVWVLPAVVLCIAIVFFRERGQDVVWMSPVISSSSVLSHFFGWGCQPRLRCIDQLIYTLPLYSSLFYSLGSLLARRLSARRTRHAWLPGPAGAETLPAQRHPDSETSEGNCR